MTIPAKTRHTILTRDGYSCLRCGVTILNRVHSVHHRKGRHCPNPNSPSNLVTLCGSGTTGCHGLVHAHPEQSYTEGWMVRRLGADDPAEVPVLDQMGHWWLVGDRLVPAEVPGGSAFLGGLAGGRATHPDLPARQSNPIACRAGTPLEGASE